MTDSAWREAFRRRIAAAGYSPRSLSLAAGLNPTAIRDILQGRSRQPRYRTLYCIAQVLGSTPEALLAEDDVTESVPEQEAREGTVVQLPAQSIESTDHQDRLQFVPLLDSGAIGQDASEESWLQGKMGLPQSFLQELEVAEPAFLRAPDDAMAPTILRGDLLLLDRAVQTPARDAIYVLARSGQVTVRRLRLDPIADNVTILADNPDYAPLEDVPSSDVPIFGLVIWQGRRL